MDITQELGSRLSSQTRLLRPSDSDFENTGKRWNLHFPIEYAAIVDASREEDVAAAIKYANSKSLPFLAFNGTHGAQLPLLNFKNGIGITTLAMKSLTLDESDGGRTAWIRGSWLSGHLRNELFKLGKRTTLGSCDSTGIIGPMLGGGHGILQGRYGLLADQIVELRVILADGSIVVVSEDENKDLFWAMRGAGHNFGVVTAIRYKVYDVLKDDEWSHGMMVFQGTQLEKLVPVFNDLLENQPVEVALWFPQIMKLPNYDAENPVVQVHILYNGPADAMKGCFAPLAALSPIANENKSVSWLEASEVIGWGFSSFCNQKGLVHVLRFPVGVKKFSYSAMKNSYDVFSAAVAAQPALAYSLVLWEAYSTHAVKAVPDEATAVADRADSMLAAAFIIVPPGTGLEGEGEKLGKDLRKALAGGEELHAYVNYAHGDESLEEVYGHQKWRLERLKQLKKKYDPENRFGFYSPIV